MGEGGEGHPGPKLIGVIRAGHSIEQKSHWIAIRVGDLPLLGARGSKISQCQVDAQVSKFTELM